MRFSAILGTTAALALAVTGGALATPTFHVPTDGGLGLQPAATPVMEDVIWFHDMLLWIITAISLLVLGLLIYVVVKFRAKNGHEPAKFSHNTTVEVIWTGVPILILIAIAIPSFQLLIKQDVLPESDFTIKTTRYQWNWGYEYPDHGGFQYFSDMVAEDDLDAHPYEAHRNLTVNNPVVVPVGATVRVEVTAADVIHNWAMPNFGIKMDAIPGRLNETWFQAPAYKPNGNNKYYGQCSEICGIDHAYMPITVEVMPRAQFNAWVDEQRDFNGMEPMFAESDETPKFAAAVADTADQLQD